MNDPDIHWKATFLAKPSISIRKGIADGYHTPVEDTSTLVLTAPSGKFIDIRFPREISDDTEARTKRLNSYESFWAFSGTSNTTFYEKSKSSNPLAVSLPYTAHTAFNHDIDSKDAKIVDQGDCFLLPNGDVMEIGVWSTTKKLYKEYWTSAQKPWGASVEKTPVVVAETIKSVTGRGIIIRIGDYIQGIFEWNEPGEDERVIVHRTVRSHNEWTDDHRNNDPESDGTIPALMLQHDILDHGTEFESAGNTWKVSEFIPAGSGDMWPTG